MRMRFSIRTFPYLEIVKGGDNVELSIDFGLTKRLKGLTYKRYWVLVLNYNSVKSSIVNAELDTFSCFLTRRIGAAASNMLGRINPLLRCSLIYFL